MGLIRRRKYWINSRLQRQYLFQILMVELVVMCVTMIGTLALALIIMNPNMEAGPTWTQIYVISGAFALSLAAALVYMGLRLSHKIYGPLYRFKTILEAVAEGGEPEMVKLRDGDELQDIAVALNRSFNVLMSAKEEGGEEITKTASVHNIGTN